VEREIRAGVLGKPVKELGVTLRVVGELANLLRAMLSPLSQWRRATW